MAKYKDLAGQQFNRLQALEFAGIKSSGALWLCQCDCGKQKVVSAKILKSGHAESCGCLNKENSAKRIATINTTHAQSKTRMYKIWKGIKKRCYNPNTATFNHYGGRGIALCEEWQSYESFYNWSIENGYDEGKSIDRIDVNGNYEPSNCRWTTMLEQSRNRRNNRYFEHCGITMTLLEWADATGINPKTLSSRIYGCGWDFEKAIKTG